jgi:Mg2+ and Co2+ transporter CorA
MADAALWRKTGTAAGCWGIDFERDTARDITLDTPRAPGSFRWLHFSLADNATRRWVEQQSTLPPPVREALVAHGSWQNSFVDGTR